MKWSGKIGFGETKEIRPGYWDDSSIIEKKYYGEVLKKVFKNQNSGGVNDDINISNRISIVANSFVLNNVSYMKYIEFMGTKWKISEVEYSPPRLILTIGDKWE